MISGEDLVSLTPSHKEIGVVRLDNLREVRKGPAVTKGIPRKGGQRFPVVDHKKTMSFTLIAFLE